MTRAIEFFRLFFTTSVVSDIVLNFHMSSQL